MRDVNIKKGIKLNVETILIRCLQGRAKDMREERRSMVTKELKYIFMIVSHYFRITKEEVEEFVIDLEDVSTQTCLTIYQIDAHQVA